MKLFSTKSEMEIPGNAGIQYLGHWNAMIIVGEELAGFNETDVGIRPFYYFFSIEEMNINTNLLSPTNWS